MNDRRARPRHKVPGIILVPSHLIHGKIPWDEHIVFSFTDEET